MKTHQTQTCSCLRALLLACMMVLAFTSAPSAAQRAFPKPRGAVNDFAGVISPGAEARMEGLAAEILQKTGASVVVGTFATLDGNDPDQFSNELYEAWGIGKKGADKGVLIMLAVQERRVRIETGFGVEGILPDGLVGSILDRYVVPLLKQDRFEEGLFNAMAATGQVIAKDAGTELTGRIQAQPRQGRYPSRRRASPLSLLPLLIIFAIMMSTRSGRRMLPFILLMALSGGRGGGGFGGGGFSGGFGGFGGGLSGGGGAGRGF
jgi:uncharacterized protein